MERQRGERPDYNASCQLQQYEDEYDNIMIMWVWSTLIKTVNQLLVLFKAVRSVQSVDISHSLNPLLLQHSVTSL